MVDTVEQLEARLEAMGVEETATMARVELLHALSEALLPRTPKRLLILNEEALALAQKLDDLDGTGISLTWIGFAQYLLARYEEALNSLQRALAILKQTGHAQGQARTYTCFAYVQHTLGDYDQALASALQAIPLYESLSFSDLWHGWNQIALSNTYLDLHEYEQAAEIARESLAIFEETSFELGQARSLIHLAAIAQRVDQYPQAVTHLERSLTLFKQFEEPLGVSRTLNDLGCVYHKMGDLEQALVFHTSGLAIRKELDNQQAQCTSLVNLGRLHIERQEFEQAIAVLQQALAIADAIKAKPKAYQAHEGLALAYEYCGDVSRALHHHKAFHALKEEVVGEETRSKFNHLQISFAVAQAEKEAEIERLRNVELERLLQELKATQAQLIHAEKMASLGALTAGIAHEIKNPLNFINNFAYLSTGLAEELVDELNAGRQQSVAEVLEEVQDLVHDLKFNAEKILEHGQRADSIVRAMMQHARGGADERRAVDVNMMLDEYVNLAYRGMQAQTPDLSVTLECSYDETAGIAEIIPQEMGRVLINLLNNAFYAVNEHDRTMSETYMPTVTVATRRLVKGVEVRISDNGPGIPAAIQEKIFEPFFTTKPTGLGTGLGLSLSYDIITQGHSGTLAVESREGEGATFIITLPLD